MTLARQRQAGWYWMRIRRMVACQLLAAGSLPCLRCGQDVRYGQPFDVDHRIPLAQGGTDAFANLGPSHPACNRRAHANLNHWGKTAVSPSRDW